MAKKEPFCGNEACGRTESHIYPTECRHDATPSPNPPLVGGLTVYAIDTVVATIARVKEAPESAHALEDTLFRDVLKAIAQGHVDPKGLAEAALKSCDIEFGRWYG